jgi:hypothetical protein
MTFGKLMSRCLRFAPIAAVLTLGLALSACDVCGDFFWQKQPGACRAAPAPK